MLLPSRSSYWESFASKWTSWWLGDRESACQCRRLGFDPWVRKIPLEKELATHSSILAWEICGQKTLVSCSPWDRKRVRHDLVTKTTAKCFQLQTFFNEIEKSDPELKLSSLIYCFKLWKIISQLFHLCPHLLPY